MVQFVANDIMYIIILHLHSPVLHYSPVVPAPWRVGDVAEHHHRVGCVPQDAGRCLCLKLSVQLVPAIENQSHYNECYECFGVVGLTLRSQSAQCRSRQCYRTHSLWQGWLEPALLHVYNIWAQCM